MLDNLDLARIEVVRSWCMSRPALSKRKWVIYTVNLGSTDRCLLSGVFSEKADLIYIYDRIVSNGNVVGNIKVPGGYSNSRMAAKVFKVLPHLFLDQYEYSLYIDANCILANNIDELLREFEASDAQLGCFQHNKRQCLYREAEECLRVGRGDRNSIRKQVATYKMKGYPESNGLNQGGFILRKHNDQQVISAMELWWHHIKMYSERDQISFNYVTWAAPLKTMIISGILHASKYTTIEPHIIREFGGRRRLSIRIIVFNCYVFFRRLVLYIKRILPRFSWWFLERNARRWLK